MDKYQEQRQKEKREKRHWIGWFLIEADCYADALRFSDLLSDGLSFTEAEQDSGARLVI